ncbi:MAG: hypothetical protein NTX70_04575 [Verrucomicrobia bacterium]|nr:hypothetical protein [Verrucomicrobiota bacterium]
MKLQYITRILALLLAAIPIIPSLLCAQQPIALWDFNQTNDLLRATSGSATLAVLGGLRTAPASGIGSSDPSTNADFALQLSGFPKQGTGARSAGLEIATSTVGFQSVVLRFDVRATSTANRRIQVLYSTDGQTLKVGPAFILNGGTTFTNGLTIDFSALPEVANQPQFRVRLVSDWDGDSYVGVAGNYSTVGTWRIDHLRLTGVSSGVQPVDPESEDPALVTIACQPLTLQVPEGGGALFRVAAKGAGPLRYQWCLNGQPLSGAIRQELRIAQVYRDQLGLYTVRVSHAEGSILSEEASLSFLTDPTIHPIRVQAEPGPLGSIRLSWPNRPGSTYSVLRSVGWDGLTSVIATGITGGSFTENPPSGNQFFYWVQIQ